MARESNEERDQKLLTRIKDRYTKGIAGNNENRKLHSEDMRFVYDAEAAAQWDSAVLGLRAGRPSYSFNRVLQPVNMICNDQRQTHPSVKVRPAHSNSKGKIAEIFGGLWRAIEQASRAEAIYDEQYKSAVAGGFGELRLLPEFLPDAFDQVLRFVNIPNPLTVVRDPESTDPCGGDAMWCIVGDRISKDKYEELYPDVDMLTFDMTADADGWNTGEEIRVVEYMERFSTEKTIALLSDGRVIDYTTEERKVDQQLRESDPDGTWAKVTKTRKVLEWKVRWCKCDGAQILEGPTEYDWKRIPVIRMPGRYVNIEGKQKFQSVIRHSKDGQRAYNFHRSDVIERSGLISKAPYMITPKMVAGLEDMWNTANTVPRPFLLFNIDKDNVNAKPSREAPIDLPAGSLALMQQDVEDIQATTGMFDASLGNADDMNRVSGKALVQHNRRSDLGSHEFIDNYGKALTLICECGLDMMRTVYDGERVERIIGLDGAESNVTLNQTDESGNILNDMTEGEYDATVTIGPSYQTGRQDALQTMIDASTTVPQIAQVAPDIVAKYIDGADTDELVRRLRIPLIAQGIVYPSEKEKERPQPAQKPDPLKQAELARAVALARKDTAGATIEESKAGAGHLELRKVLADIVHTELDSILKAQAAHAGGAQSDIDAMEGNVARETAQGA